MVLVKPYVVRKELNPFLMLSVYMGKNFLTHNIGGNKNENIAD
jgi:hypothetical protein